MPHFLPMTSLVALVALFVYIWTGMRVGSARVRFKIDAPATSGDPAFERIYRAQMNTAEQIILFLPALFLFSLTLGDGWGALIGIFWPVGRIHYALAYAKAAEKRHVGFMVGFLSTALLLVGALIAIVLDLIATW